MKRIILITLVLLFTISAYSLPGSIISVKPMQIFISDPAINNYYYGYRAINIKRIGEQHYIFTPVYGDFSDVPYEANITTITIDQSRCIVIAKSDDKIEVYSALPINVGSASWFHIGVSTGHAISCRDQLRNELGDISADIWVSPISFNTNLVGVMDNLNIDILSVSQKGMSDNYNLYHAPPFTAKDVLIVYAHGDNNHIELDDPTDIGDIVTVSYGANTGTNKGSYGKGIELIFDPATTQSKATPHVAGIFAKLKILTGKSWNEIRTALRETASNHGVWDKCEGYGIVNYDLALKELSYKKPPRIMPEFIPKNRARIDK